MSVSDLCEAAVTRSDNTAANLLLASLGGPSAFNAYARSINDRVTRLDRIEPEMSESTPGDPRDTTTPRATIGNLQKLILGNALSPNSRTLLTGWIVGNKTGDERLRAGLPHGLKVGDKTGSGDHGTTNDIAVLWPPHQKPVIIAVYLTGSTLSSAGRNATIASVGRLIL
jgi:beta-lactamase class A